MPDWLIDIPVSFWVVLSEMGPYLLFGFLAAGILSVLISPRTVERHLGGGSFWSVLKAAAFGVPLPLCSCGVIPVSASLRRSGAGKGATAAFLISTPQTGVDSILVTFSLLGGIYAIFRPLAALLTGLLGGLVVNLAEPREQEQDTTGESRQSAPVHVAKAGKVRHIFSYGFDTLPRDIGRALLVGLVIAALISAIVPEDYFSDVVPPGIWQMLVLMLAGIPVYVCATASIPLAYALIVAGVSPGAAFAFLMTGPATNAATIATIWKLMGRRTTIIYLAAMIAGALVGGLLLDQIVTGEQVTRAHEMRWMLPPIVKHVSAVVLLGVLFSAVIRPHLRKPIAAVRETPEMVKLKITGMTCSHCADSVRRALLASGGVTFADVDLEEGLASVSGDGISAADLCAAVEELGYAAKPLSDAE